jgi:hypothetical protein
MGTITRAAKSHVTIHRVNLFIVLLLLKRKP